MKADFLPVEMINFFWSAIDKRLSEFIAKAIASTALIISLSDLLEIVQTFNQAELSAGALITTAGDDFEDIVISP